MEWLDENVDVEAELGNDMLCLKLFYPLPSSDLYYGYFFSIDVVLHIFSQFSRLFGTRYLIPLNKGITHISMISRLIMI